MKLRIKGNSIRLRVSQTDMAALLRDGRIAESVRFSLDASLTYAIEVREQELPIAIEYRDGSVTVLLSPTAARRWSGSDDVGVYGDAETGVALLVEKDFACLDGNDPVDEDAFPNPAAGVAC